MKKLNIVTLGILLLSGFLFNSCSDDAEFSLDKMAEGIVTVIGGNWEGASDFLLGDSLRLVVAANGIPNVYPESPRVKINFTPLGWLEERDGYYIKLNGMKSLLTKPISIVEEEHLNEIKNDPIEGIYHLSISDGYLNIGFKYAFASQFEHDVDLYRVIPRIVTGTYTTENEILMEFRHDANGDDKRWVKTELVCFNLKEMLYGGSVNKTYNLKIRFSTPGGVNEYEIEYTYR